MHKIKGAVHLRRERLRHVLVKQLNTQRIKFPLRQLHTVETEVARVYLRGGKALSNTRQTGEIPHPFPSTARDVDDPVDFRELDGLRQEVRVVVHVLDPTILNRESGVV